MRHTNHLQHAILSAPDSSKRRFWKARSHRSPPLRKSRSALSSSLLTGASRGRPALPSPARPAPPRQSRSRWAPRRTLRPVGPARAAAQPCSAAGSTPAPAACRAAWHGAGATPPAGCLAARWGLLPRDFWRTPPELVAAFAGARGGPFGLAAASAGDDAVAGRWLPPDEDDRTSRWAEGLVVALLVPSSTSTRYRRRGCAEAAKHVLPARRVARLDPNTGLPQRRNLVNSAMLIVRLGQRGPALVRSWWPVEAT
jgi:hypothetical protein